MIKLKCRLGSKKCAASLHVQAGKPAPQLRRRELSGNSRCFSREERGGKRNRLRLRTFPVEGRCEAASDMMRVFRTSPSPRPLPWGEGGMRLYCDSSCYD